MPQKLAYAHLILHVDLLSLSLCLLYLSLSFCVLEKKHGELVIEEEERLGDGRLETQ